jgi:pimeloyl-ACP methyl ester carboxylesterase
MIEDPRGRVDYEEQGTGPAILFVPGSWSTCSAWRGVIAPLADRFRIVTTSLLGYGNTEERRSMDDASIDREAEIVEAVIRRAGGAIHLVGHSFGGAVCLAIVLRRAAQLASLTLIEPTIFSVLRRCGDVELYEEVRAMSEAYSEAYRNGEGDAARRVIDFYGGRGSFDAFPQRMRDAIVATTATNILDWMSGMDFDQELASYASITVPSLVIRGECGHPTVRRAAEILSGAIPKSAFVTVPTASHFVIATHSLEVARLIEEHISKTETVGSHRDRPRP